MEVICVVNWMVRFVIVVVLFYLVLDFIIGGINMLPLFAAAAAVSAWEGFAAGVSLGVAVYKATKS